MQVATVIRIDDCQSCGECLEACREHAIRKSFSIPETGSGHQRI
jgi:ferredoxin